MGRVAVEQLLYLMDEVFEGADEEDLLGNLRAVTQHEWSEVPPGCMRSIRQIIGHVGACKYMYDNHAFGNGSMTWEDPAGDLGVSMEDLQSRTLALEPPMKEITEWLGSGHHRLRGHVAELDDAELVVARRPPEGESRETRWIIANMIRHDDYHAGEINHLRALMQGNDGWAWESG
ncbi:MAG: DinB family protein [Chloroflexi bacterium]|nr:MAG: DinB family protein [Chloroflexota bacterium]